MPPGGRGMLGGVEAERGPQSKIMKKIRKKS